ncbi:hypothetical protein NDU88_007235 [Pleurodeles waltl]|uniref:Uncharacterized protein n=1 Tax=Pleurodeles waltl TaxID=8319 RepID=A0AAV7LUU7_PLEWA|nr:hypothetical protein NDU88_007235 [Pleurodeles waltl]
MGGQQITLPPLRGPLVSTAGPEYYTDLRGLLRRSPAQRLRPSSPPGKAATSHAPTARAANPQLTGPKARPSTLGRSRGPHRPGGQTKSPLGACREVLRLACDAVRGGALRKSSYAAAILATPPYYYIILDDFRVEGW